MSEAPMLLTPPDLLDTLLAMTRTRERAEVDALLLTALAGLSGALRVRLWRVKGELQGPRHWILCGEHCQGEARGTPLEHLGEAARTLVPWLALPDHVRCAEAGGVVERERAEVPPGWYTGVPLMTEVGVEGLIEFDSAQPLGEARLAAAQRLLEGHRNVIGLLDYSERDTLTQLLNRKSFDTTFMHATVAEARRLFALPEDPTPVERRQGFARQHWLGVIDIDHFKRVNDSLGHDAGDKVLQGVAHLLRASLRESDLLARWGGEEFLVLLPATDMTEACLVAEKLRQAVEQAPDLGAGGITLSIGVATAGPDQLSEDDAVRLADLRLYGAKKAGRNRVQAGAAA